MEASAPLARSVVGVLLVVCSIVLVVNIDLDWPARAPTQLFVVALATAMSAVLVAWSGRGVRHVVRAVSLNVLAAGVAASVAAAVSWSDRGDLSQGQTIAIAVGYAVGIALLASTLGGVGAVVAARLRRP